MKEQPQLLRTRLHYGSPIFAYVLAAVLVVISGLLRVYMPVVGPAGVPFLFLFPAVCLASFLGGTGPGLMAVCVGAVFAIFGFPVKPQPVSWIALSILGPLLVAACAHLREIRDASHVVALECARFRFISDHAADWLLLLNDSGCLEYVNHSAARQLGFEPEQMLGRHLEDLVPEWQRTGVKDMLSGARQGAPVKAELTFTGTDNSVTIVEAGCTAVETGGVTVMHIAARDITERSEMEFKLREAQKWESLGVLAGGLAHDFNNLLTSILGNASLAEEFLESEHPATPLVQAIERSGERSAVLIRLMLATAGQRSTFSEKIPVGDLVQMLADSGCFPEQTRLTRDIADPALPVDGRSVSTILESLLLNAAESYDPGGGEVRLRICAGDIPLPGTVSFEEGKAGSGTFLGIVVEDSGCGMSKRVLERAFDPFFSTKFTGRGLGLPATRGLVRAHGGKMWLKTEEGKGTRVEVWLPMASIA